MARMCALASPTHKSFNEANENSVNHRDDGGNNDDNETPTALPPPYPDVPRSHNCTRVRRLYAHVCCLTRRTSTSSAQRCYCYFMQTRSALNLSFSFACFRMYGIRIVCLRCTVYAFVNAESIDFACSPRQRVEYEFRGFACLLTAHKPSTSLCVQNRKDGKIYSACFVHTRIVRIEVGWTIPSRMVPRALE